MSEAFGKQDLDRLGRAAVVPEYREEPPTDPDGAVGYRRYDVVRVQAGETETFSRQSRMISRRVSIRLKAPTPFAMSGQSEPPA